MTRRRRYRRLLAVALVFGLGFGGYRFYRSDIWLKWLPTQWLLAIPDGFDRASDELIARDVAGSLSLDEQVSLVHRFFDIQTHVRSPRPVGDTFAADIYINERSSDLTSSIHDYDPKVALDDEPANITSVHVRNLSPSFMCKMPNTMTKGMHVVSGRVVFVAELKGKALISFPVSFEHEVRVTDKPYSSYVEPRFDETLGQQVAEGLSWSICPNARGSESLRVQVKEIESPLAGEIVLRIRGVTTPIGARQITVESSVNSNFGASSSLVFPTNITAEDIILDARFTPDLQVAFDEGFTECFGGIVEWNGIRLSELRALSAGVDSGRECRNCEPPFGRAPDVIRV